MKISTPVLVAVIGAAGVVIAALITALLPLNPSNTQPAGPMRNGGPPATAVFTPRALSANFFPSGWMGDAEKGTAHLTTKPETVTIDGSARAAICFTYTRGAQGWAGVYWQHPENNWGDVPGADLQGASRITFFAKGTNGGEIVDFISGGMNGKRYIDSYRISTGQAPLSREWTRYSLDLGGKDLSNVIGAFAWSAPGVQSAAVEFCIADVTIR